LKSGCGLSIGGAGGFQANTGPSGRRNDTAQSRLVPFNKIVRYAATAIPAQILGVEDRFGRLEPGYVADAVIFDEDWQVQGVWIDGRPSV